MREVVFWELAALSLANFWSGNVYQQASYGILLHFGYGILPKYFLYLFGTFEHFHSVDKLHLIQKLTVQ